MRPRLPPLAALRAFEAVARLGSVGRAAEELGRTHGAVSKQLQALRLDAGVPLFDKVGTGLAPNAAGKRLAAAVGLAFDDLGQAYAEVVREARAPELRIACSASFAMGWLVPHLPRFSERHPQVRLQLSMTSAKEMREERDADLVILWDRSAYPPEDQARAIRLADAQFGPVAAPDYLVEQREGVLHVGRPHARRAGVAQHLGDHRRQLQRQRPRRPVLQDEGDRQPDRDRDRQHPLGMGVRPVGEGIEKPLHAAGLGVAMGAV